MKANELQIGDYVNYRGQIIKVTSLYDKGGSNEVGWSDKESVWVNADNVEPIPLTAEILEKNLSTTSQIQYCWDDFLSNSFGEDFYEIRYHGDVTELVISIRYVHELQHVLKLCKIEKEVIL